MRRLMTMVENRRVDLTSLVTHTFALDDIQEAFDLFSHQRDGVLKVALYPDAVPVGGQPRTVGVGVQAEGRSVMTQWRRFECSWQQVCWSYRA